MSIKAEQQTDIETSCSRCGHEMRPANDEYGDYARCLFCGHHEYSADPGIAGDTSLPYIGAYLPLVGRGAAFEELPSQAGNRNSGMRIVYCPRTLRGATCGLEMDKTRAVHQAPVARNYDGTTALISGTRYLIEYRCNRKHYIGITSSFTGWMEVPHVGP